MQRLTLSIPVTDEFMPRDAFRVYGNVGSAGEALDAIDEDRPIGGSVAREFYPNVTELPGYGEGVFGVTPFGGVPRSLPGDHSIVTPPLFCGEYEFGVKTVDKAGNATDYTRTFVAVINSGPNPVREFKQSGTSSGRPVFSFTAPAQYR